MHNRETPQNFLNLKPKDRVIRIMPLGGIGHIGMNCHLIEYNGEIMMVDCGQMMPTEEMLGVDYVIPDIRYVLDRIDRFVGIAITHAHEDHVGGLPYILKMLPENTPVYGSEFTIAILKEKFKEHRLRPNFKQYHGRERFNLGKSFVIEPIAVTHSMIDAFAFAITTPIGTIIHSGDFKMDPAPMDGVAFDFHSFSRYAEGDDEGVLALLADSTNADRPGSCPSESIVVPTLDRLIREATGQVILSCFASSMHRIQTVLNLAAEHGRTVFAAGLNMERNIRVARQIKALEVPCAYYDDSAKVSLVPPSRRLILTTGSQGEPLSALTRMALGNHKHVEINPGDSVILSARMIPGNEKGIYRLINHLARRGAKVFTTNNTPGVHVSGHAYRDEMRHLINLVNPKFHIPIHGEYRHLMEHASVAYDVGLTRDEVCIIESGDCLELDAHHARVVGKIPHGRVFVDGKGIGDVEEIVLRDRRYLADDGVVIVMLSVDRETGEVVGGPYLHSRGVVADADAGPLLDRAAKEILNAYNALDVGSQEEGIIVQDIIRKTLRQFLKRELDRYPVIMPVVMEV